MSDLSQLFDRIADDLENCGWSENTLIEFGNTLINMSLSVDDTAVLESMLNALYTIADDKRPIARKLDIKALTEDMQRFDLQCTDHILSILSFTGDKKYCGLIRDICNRHSSLSAEGYLAELAKRSELFSIGK